MMSLGLTLPTLAPRALNILPTCVQMKFWTEEYRSTSRTGQKKRMG